GLGPRRRRGGGATPSAGWSYESTWPLERLSARDSGLNRFDERALAAASNRTMPAVLSSIDSIGPLPGDLEAIRDRLKAAGSPELLLRVFYTARRMALEKGAVPHELLDEALYAVDPMAVGVDPEAAMFAAQPSG